MLVCKHLLGSIGTRMTDAPHPAGFRSVIGLLERVEDRNQPRLGRRGSERRLARRERAEVGRMPGFAFLGAEPLDDSPGRFLVLALCRDATAPDATMCAGAAGADREDLDADLLRRKRGGVGIDRRALVDRAP